MLNACVKGDVVKAQQLLTKDPSLLNDFLDDWVYVFLFSFSFSFLFLFLFFFFFFLHVEFLVDLLGVIYDV